jgi:hypothetical protein
MKPVLPMSQVQDQALKRTLAILNSLKCEYAIVDPWGNKHGNLELAVPEDKKTPRKYPHGERSNFVKKFMQKMVIGDVVEIPFDKYEPIEIQTSSISAANKMWGVGSVTTSTVKSKNAIELMRVL